MIKQFLVDLNQFKKVVNNSPNDDELAPPGKTQLILLGHSFGGLVMYHALYSGLIERARHLRKVADNSYRYGTAKSFGDFILLVNLAFEASAYEPLWEAIQTRCYPENERPVTAIVTSEGDWATGLAFPLGRAYTIFQSAPQPDEPEAVRSTVGHFSRYETHRLTPWTGDGAAEATRESPLLAASTARKRYGDTMLERVKAGPDRLPYLVITADKEVIKDHGDVWNPKFSSFMREFFRTEVVKPNYDEAKYKADVSSAGSGIGLNCAPFEHRLPGG